MSLPTHDSGGSWLRRWAAAAIAAAGVLIPAGYTAATDEASPGPYGYLAGVGVIMLLTASLVVAGALGAALVRGRGGSGALLGGLLIGCIGLEVVFVVALGKPVDVAGTAALFALCTVPLLVGYGFLRGLARLG